MTDSRSGDRTLGIDSEVEQTTVRRIVGVLVGLAGLLLVLGLVAFLPAADRLLAAITVSPVALLIAVATLLVVGALVILAPTVQDIVEQGLDGPDAVVDNAGASATYLVLFGAVVVAYNGFAGAVLPLFGAFGIEGLYHLGFLAAGLLALGLLVRRLYRCWGPVTDLLTAYATDALGGTRVEVAESR